MACKLHQPAWIIYNEINLCSFSLYFMFSFPRDWRAMSAIASFAASSLVLRSW